MAMLVQLEEFCSGEMACVSHGFGDTSPGATAPHEELTKEAYEQGYSAGWDDAARAAQEEQSRISTEFAHNLLDLGFTFHEAKAHVIGSLGPLLTSIFDKLLPEIVSATIGQRILSEIIPLAEIAVDNPIKILVAPECRSSLEPLLQSAGSHPFELIEEPCLGVGQAQLRAGNYEVSIDLDGAIQKIKGAISAVQSTTHEAIRNEK